MVSPEFAANTTTFFRDTTTPITAGGSGLALADFNADGRTDAVVTSQAVGLMTVLLSPSPAQPPPPQPTPTATPAPTPPATSPATGARILRSRSSAMTRCRS
jgi:hypothetical protein